MLASSVHQLPVPEERGPVKGYLWPESQALENKDCDVVLSPPRINDLINENSSSDTEIRELEDTDTNNVTNDLLRETGQTNQTGPTGQSLQTATLESADSDQNTSNKYFFQLPIHKMNTDRSMNNRSRFAINQPSERKNDYLFDLNMNLLRRVKRQKGEIFTLKATLSQVANIIEESFPGLSNKGTPLLESLQNVVVEYEAVRAEMDKLAGKLTAQNRVQMNKVKILSQYYPQEDVIKERASFERSNSFSELRRSQIELQELRESIKAEDCSDDGTEAIEKVFLQNKDDERSQELLDKNLNNLVTYLEESGLRKEILNFTTYITDLISKEFAGLRSRCQALSEIGISLCRMNNKTNLKEKNASALAKNLTTQIADITKKYQSFDAIVDSMYEGDPKKFVSDFKRLGRELEHNSREIHLLNREISEKEVKCSKLEETVYSLNRRIIATNAKGMTVNIGMNDQLEEGGDCSRIRELIQMIKQQEKEIQFLRHQNLQVKRGFSN